MNIRLFLPIIIFVPTWFGARHYNFPPPVNCEAVTSVAATFTQVGASMLGFMLAAMAILATISDSHLVKVMKQQGHYDDLLKTLYMGCVVYLFMAGFGVIAMFGGTYETLFKYLFVSISVSSLVSLLDLGHKFWLVLSNLHK
jgi:hypothetical protein